MFAKHAAVPGIDGYHRPIYGWVDEWIKKLWYIYTMEYYSVIKKNTFQSVLMKRMNLEPITQNSVSQKNKNIVY